MSAILSADDLNDFISPGVACIKPVEIPSDPHPEKAYEVTTEDSAQQEAKSAQISLTDCLACSGCVTSAEAVLVSLQSHAEVLNALESNRAFPIDTSMESRPRSGPENTKIFVASVSAQARASLAATYNVTEREAGYLIQQLLCGPEGLASAGLHGTSFAWVMDIDPIRDLCLTMGAEEVANAINTKSRLPPLSGVATESSQFPRLPILTSACPGWVCYAEKTHPHVLHHLSRIKSPQAIAGTLLKSILANHYQIDPAQIWHLAIMPCFDKKLEASREELTDAAWRNGNVSGSPVRDVDCVITAKEVLMLADSRGIRFSSLPKSPVASQTPFPDQIFENHLFKNSPQFHELDPIAGTSGGFLYNVIAAQQSANPGSMIQSSPGRNLDVVDFSLTSDRSTLFKGARFYGFRNIQNLVRKLKPPRTGRDVLISKGSTGKKTPYSNIKELEYAYIEVMACPGGCTNGGGQIKASELSDLQSPLGDISQRAWLNTVDEVYFSKKTGSDMSSPKLLRDRPPLSFQERMKQAHELIQHWSQLVSIPREKLVSTTYREVESFVGKAGKDTEKVAVLASKIGGGW